MKILDGLELAGYIKERQLKQVRALRQSWRIVPKLAILQTVDSSVIDVYVRLKEKYGDDILVEVEHFKLDQGELASKTAELNSDDLVHGIIIQLPLADKSATERALNNVAPEKDVDGLGIGSTFTPATPMAVEWLLAGYNVDLKGKAIAIIGNGRLVGAPLAKLWKEQGFLVEVYDAKSDLSAETVNADVIVSATGVPGLITRDMVKPGAVVVDGGTASENGKIVGDVADDVRSLDDIRRRYSFGKRQNSG